MKNGDTVGKEKKNKQSEKVSCEKNTLKKTKEMKFCPKEKI